jgi:AcrR family transcriptional regulator
MSRIEAETRRLSTGRRERRKRVTRNELLVAGRKLFGTRGLYESRIEDLSSHAGIAKGTLYGYFESKEELIQAVVAAGLDELLHAARGAHGIEHDHAARLRGIIRRQIAFLEKNPDLLRIFHQARGLLMFDRGTWRPLREIFLAYFNDLGHLLEGGALGADRGAPPRVEEACGLFAVLSGTVSAREAFLRGKSASPEIAESGLFAFAATWRRSGVRVARSAGRRRGIRRTSPRGGK